MKKIYSTIIFVFALTITYSQGFEFSLSYVGVNPNTNNHQVAFIATPSISISNGLLWDMGAGFYVPSGMTIGNFEAGNSGIPLINWFIQSLGSNGNGDAYFITGFTSIFPISIMGSGPFQLVLFDIIADPNPVTGSITFIENGAPIFGLTSLQNYFFIDIGPAPADLYVQNDSTANSIDFSTLNTRNFDVFSFKLFPNPSKGMLHIKGNVDKLRTVKIYSITGQQVMIIKDNFKAIDISNLDPALYFVKLYTIESSKVFKIVRE